jgi:NDP-sugar pyrophosphorylase family protein
MSSQGKRGRVVILAGGQGKRLAPYTFVIPKPIVPIGTTPILEIVLRQLAAHGFTSVTIALGHMSEIIKAVAGDGKRFGVEITYSQETQPLGTVGPLRLIDGLEGDFIVMNADLLTDLDFSSIWEFHKERGAIATVATYQKSTKLELGVLESDADGRILSFKEKPTLVHNVSMGIYVFSQRVLEYIPPATHFGFDALMLALLAKGERVQAFAFNGRWLDIGVPADYERAQQEFEENRAAYIGGDSTAR